MYVCHDHVYTEGQEERTAARAVFRTDDRVRSTAVPANYAYGDRTWYGAWLAKGG